MKEQHSHKNSEDEQEDYYDLEWCDDDRAPNRSIRHVQKTLAMRHVSSWDQALVQQRMEISHAMFQIAVNPHAVQPDTTRYYNPVFNDLSNNGTYYEDTTSTSSPSASSKSDGEDDIAGVIRAARGRIMKADNNVDEEASKQESTSSA